MNFSCSFFLKASLICIFWYFLVLYSTYLNLSQLNWRISLSQKHNRAWLYCTQNLFLSWTWKEKKQTENRIIYNLERIILSNNTFRNLLFHRFLSGKNLIKKPHLVAVCLNNYLFLVIPSSLESGSLMVGVKDQKICNQINVFVRIMESWFSKCSGTDFSSERIFYFYECFPLKLFSKLLEDVLTGCCNK